MHFFCTISQLLSYLSGAKGVLSEDCSLADVTDGPLLVTVPETESLLPQDDTWSLASLLLQLLDCCTDELNSEDILTGATGCIMVGNRKELDGIHITPINAVSMYLFNGSWR